MSEQQTPDVIVRGASRASEEAAHKKSQAIDAYLAQHDKPEDHKLNEGEETKLAEFVEAKRFSSTIADADEQQENDSVLGLKIHDWVTGNDLTSGQSDTERDENGIAKVDYIRALAKRRRQEAALNAGLL